MHVVFDRIWHGLIGRPYLLSRPIDSGAGQAVILLHGIGRTGQVWQHVVEALRAQPVRIIAFDLLGFGSSPKPTSLSYNVGDHAQAVIASIEKLKLGGPIILVGHSMGSLVAVHIGRLRPDLVKHLVLYEMPLYEGLPSRRIYRLRLELYARFFDKIMSFQPKFDSSSASLIERLAQKVAGLEVDQASWQPFIKSLEQTIINQTTAQDIVKLEMPMDVIYGRLDMLVIRGKPQQIFGEGKGNISTYTIRARHTISAKASQFIVERINAALYDQP